MLIVAQGAGPGAAPGPLPCFGSDESLHVAMEGGSQAICNVLMPLLLEAGEEGGFENLLWHKIHLRQGIYIFKGALTNFYLSQRFDLKYTDLNLLIASRR